MSHAEAVISHESLDSHSSGQSQEIIHQMAHPGFIVSGALLAVAVAFGHWFLSEQAILESLAILGGLLGGAYAGMGVVNPDSKKMWVQMLMAGVIAGCAFAGLWVSPVFFALACFAHGIWDVVTRHPKCLNLPLVNWYVPMCMGFDFLFGMFILVWWAL